jgi:hypothetical protein
MVRPQQVSLAYIFLEMFWIASTLALWRAAYRLYVVHREFFGGWSPPENGKLFLVLVLAAIFCGGTALGGLIGRMQLGAVVAAVVAIGAMVVLSPGVQ